MPRRTWSGGASLVTRRTEAVSLLAANFDEFADGGGQYTLQFQVTPPANGNPAAPQAVILWFAQGNTIRRVISLDSGVSISGAGNSVNVQVVDATPDYSGIGIAGGDAYQVLANLVPGVRPVVGFPPALVGLTSNVSGTNLNSSGLLILTPGNQDFYVVPQNSGVFACEVTAFVDTPLSAAPNPVGNLVVEQGNSGGGFYKFYDPCVNTGFVRLATNTPLVVVRNFSTTTTMVYSLNWGIDG